VNGTKWSNIRTQLESPHSDGIRTPTSARERVFVTLCAAKF